MESSSDEFKQGQRTFLRERFLRMLAVLTGTPACIKMHEKTKVTCLLGPSDVEFQLLQVTDLATPMGVVPYAMLRTNICRIHARLFDHRSAFQGHANFFAKEFEEKRGDREKVRLDRMLEIVTHERNDILPETHTAFSNNLKSIAEKVAAAETACQQILSREESRKSEFLENQRAARQQAFEEFMKQQCVRSARVDQQFDENIKLFNAGYDDLNEKLEQGVGFTSQTYYKFMALGKEFS